MTLGDDAKQLFPGAISVEGLVNDSHRPIFPARNSAFGYALNLFYFIFCMLSILILPLCPAGTGQGT